MQIWQELYHWWAQLTALNILLGLSGLFLIWSQVLLVLAFVVHLYSQKQRQAQQAFEDDLQPQIIQYIFQANLAAETIWDAVPAKKQRAFLNLLLRIQGPLKGEAAERLQTLAQPYLALAIKEQQSRKAEIRAQALKILSVFAPQEHQSLLETALQDKSVLVSYIAFEALTRPDSQSRIAPLMQALAQLSYFSSDLLSSLLQRRGSELSPALRQDFANPEVSIHTRVVMGKTLILLKDYGALQAAESILRQEQEPDILVPALILLEKLGLAASLELIIPLCNVESAAVRSHALRALTKLGGKDYLNYFLKALEDISPWVRRQAAQALCQLCSPEELQELIQAQHPSRLLVQQTLETLKL